MKEEIEKKLSVKVPCDYEAYFNNLIKHSIEEENVIDLKHLSNDWKYANYNFWMLKQVDNRITDLHLKENKNKLSIIKTSIALSQQLRQNVLCIAWSHNSIERDTGLFYLDDKIYGYSLNFSDNRNIDFIADNLDQLLNNHENQVKNIDDILDPSSWHLGDPECITTGQEYNAILKSYFENTSNHKIKLSDIHIERIGETIKVDFKINNSPQYWILEYNNGWIDDNMVSLINFYLETTNFNKRYYLLKHPTWGQELGIAFCSKEQAKELDNNTLLQ